MQDDGSASHILYTALEIYNVYYIILYIRGKDHYSNSFKYILLPPWLHGSINSLLEKIKKSLLLLTQKSVEYSSIL